METSSGELWKYSKFEIYQEFMGILVRQSASDAQYFNLHKKHVQLGHTDGCLDKKMV